MKFTDGGRDDGQQAIRKPHLSFHSGELKTDAPCHSRYDTLENPHCSMVMSAAFYLIYLLCIQTSKLKTFSRTTVS